MYYFRSKKWTCNSDFQSKVFLQMPASEILVTVSYIYLSTAIILVPSLPFQICLKFFENILAGKIWMGKIV